MAILIQNIPSVAQENTWDVWNGNMLHYFGEEPLPYVVEDNWAEFARNMIGLSTFSSYAIPDPSGFDKWQDWVSATITAVNGPTE